MKMKLMIFLIFTGCFTLAYNQQTQTNSQCQAPVVVNCNSGTSSQDACAGTPTSCANVRSSSRTSGYYLISPDGSSAPMKVFCNFTSNEAETFVYHNYPSEYLTTDCEPVRCSKYQLIYDLSMPQMVALIDQSAECRQFVKFRCNGMWMFRFHHSVSNVAWLSRDGTPQRYWGGATSRRKNYCACGETNSCANKAYQCNCDANDDVPRSDEGYLTDKSKLPVTEVQFGDGEGATEKGWFTVGPLICTGSFSS